MLDSLWNGLMWLLPDLTPKETFEAVRDLLSLGIAALGSYLAYLAIRMGRRQTALGEEQKAIALRQEALDIEQGKIARRQGEIAEEQQKVTSEQHALVMQQVAQRGKLSVIFEPLTLQYAESVVFNVDVYIRNDGWLRVDDCTWSIFGQFEDMTDSVGQRNMGESIEGTHKGGWTGRFSDTVSSGQLQKIGILRARKRWVREDGLDLWWFIDTPTQRFPEDKPFGHIKIGINDFKAMYRWGTPPQS